MDNLADPNKTAHEGETSAHNPSPHAAAVNESDEADALRLLIWQRRLIIALLSLVLVWFTFAVGGYFADVLRILITSLFLSYMVINIVDFLEKYLRLRALAVLVVYIVLLALALLAAVVIIPALVMQISQLVQTTVDSLPQMIQYLSDSTGPLLQRLKAYQIDIKLADILQKIVDNLPTPDPTAVFSRVTDVALGTMAWLFYAISISVVTFYFLLEGPKISQSMIKLFPVKHQADLRSFVSEADRSLQSFFRGQIILGLAFGVVMLVVYTLLGVQYALLLGIFLGIMEILPVIGPPIGFFPAVLAIAFHGSNIPGGRFVQVLVLFGIFTILQQAKDSVVGPRYIGNVIGLHPILICLAIMVGARLDGTLGVIFALPAACIINVAINQFRASWKESRGAQEQLIVPASPTPEQPSSTAS